MKRRSDSKNEITKTRIFPQRTTRKLENSKEIDGDGKKSHKEAVQQEKIESTRTKRKE